MKQTCFTLVVSILLTLMSSVLTNVDSLKQTVADISLNTSAKTALSTKDYGFVDNKIILVLTNQQSLLLKDYEPGDFSEVSCHSVRNLTQTATNILRADQEGIEYTPTVCCPEDTITFSDMHSIERESFNQILCLTLSEHSFENVLHAVDVLSRRNDVQFASPDYILELCSTTPDDEYYDQQPACQIIDLPKAWDITRGTASVVVGVLDTGIDNDHDEFDGRIVEDLCLDFSTNGDPVEYLFDYDGHGTHVAGIIAAKGYNSLGIAGVAWNIKLASLRVWDDNNNATVEYVIDAINFATEAEIPILNFSNTFRTGLTSDMAALRFAIDNYTGLFVCAAGNKLVEGEILDNDTTEIYPANFQLDNMITVAASTPSDSKWSDSHYGKTTVDIFAPGTDIISCYSTDICSDRYCSMPITHFAGEYHRISGTSMATPYVTGVAALILSQYPNLTPAQIKYRIMHYAEYPSALANYCVSGGRVNAYYALHNHSLGYSAIGDPLVHRATCSCGLVTKLQHSYVSFGNQYRCSLCGQTTLYLPYSYKEELIA